MVSVWMKRNHEYEPYCSPLFGDVSSKQLDHGFFLHQSIRGIVLNNTLIDTSSGLVSIVMKRAGHAYKVYRFPTLGLMSNYLSNNHPIQHENSYSYNPLRLGHRIDR